MKRVGLILILINLLLPNSNAQSSLNISGGTAMPLGKFAETSLGDGGYAKLGYSYGLEASYYFPSRLGFGLQVNYHNNPLDIEALEQDAKTDLGYKATRPNSAGSNTSYSALAMGGYKIVDRNRFSITANAGAGLALNSMSKAVNFGVSNNGVFVENIYVDYDNKYTFAYTIGTRFLYYVSPSLGLTAGVWYYSTTPDYKIVKQKADFKGTISSTVVREYSMANNILDFRLGLVFGN